jgi:uncharacterized protein YggE
MIVCQLSAQSDPKTTMEIKGQGEIKTLPDIGVINLFMQVVDKQFGNTVTRLNEKTDKIYAQLEKIGIKKEQIKTTNFSVAVNHVYNNGKNYDSGYIGTQTVTAEFVNTKEMLSGIINSFAESNTGVQFNFSFGISDQKKKELRNDLIQLAVKDATSVAKLITTATERQLDKIVEIKYGNAENPNVFSLEDNIGVGYGVSLKKDMGFQVKEIKFTDYVIIKWLVK